MIKGGFGTKIFEFKIWGRNDFRDVVSQLLKYLTDFEKIGYIVMMNNNIYSIVEKYQSLIEADKTYMKGSFNQIEANNSDYIYYRSKHNFNGIRKEIFHFIVNIN